MNAPQLYLETIERADGTLKRAIEGLTTEELRQQVAGPSSNPIGWLLWHLTRSRDSSVANFDGTKTLWETEWAARFGMDASPTRFEPQNVHTFDPKDLDALVGYFNAVAEQTASVVKGLTEADLERSVPAPVPGRPPSTIAARLSMILNDNLQHIGQIAYLRGMLRGQGWL